MADIKNVHFPVSQFIRQSVSEHKEIGEFFAVRVQVQGKNYIQALPICTP